MNNNAQIIAAHGRQLIEQGNALLRLANQLESKKRKPEDMKAAAAVLLRMQKIKKPRIKMQGV